MLSESERRKLRRKATVVHWAAQAYVLALILLTIFGVQAIGENYAQARLASTSLAMMDAFNAFSETRLRELPAYLPPADSAARGAWAVRIQEGLGQSAAVFLQNGARLTWLSRPAHLAPALPQAERALRPQPGDTLRGRVDTLGAMLVGSYSLEREPLDSTASVLWVVGPIGDSLRWGVALSWFDGWQAFFKDLDRVPAPTAHAVTRLVRHLVQADGGHFSYRTGVRAKLDGKQIYASPGLDTARPGFHSDLRRLQIDYYLSRADLLYGSFSGSPLRWSRVLAYALFMLLFYLHYRWIRRLTD